MTCPRDYDNLGEMKGTTMKKCAVLILLLAGCDPVYRQTSTPNPGFDLSTLDKRRTIMVPVVSDPPGARIVVNDDYIGDAPCEIPMTLISHRMMDGTYAPEYAAGLYVIKALPAHPGESPQVTVLSDRVPPKRLLFVMDLVRVPREINVNLGNQ